MPNQTPVPGHCNHPLPARSDPRLLSSDLCSHPVTYGVKCAAEHDVTYHVAPADTGSAPPSKLIDSAPALDAPVSRAGAALNAFVADVSRLGVTGDSEPPDGAFDLDFHNSVVGGPYLASTGWFPTRGLAETAASLLLPRLNAIALELLAEDPGFCDTSWTDPEEEALQSDAYLASRGDEIVYDAYRGDESLGISVTLGSLSSDQQQRLDDLRAFLRSVGQEELFNNRLGIPLPAAS